METEPVSKNNPDKKIECLITKLNKEIAEGLQENIKHFYGTEEFGENSIKGLIWKRQN